MLKFIHYALLVNLFTFNIGAINWPWSRHNYDAPVPQEIKKVLDNHIDEIHSTIGHQTDNTIGEHRNVANFNWLPNWIVKSDDGRIEGAKILSDAINKFGYDKLTIPKKYLYRTNLVETCSWGSFFKKSKKNPANPVSYTIAKKVKHSNLPITIDELKQLKKLAKNARWIDIHWGNVWKIREGKIAIIDTEKSYVGCEIGQEWLIKDENDLRSVVINGLSWLKLDNEAREYLEYKRSLYNLYMSPEVAKKLEQKRAWKPVVQYLKKFNNNLYSQLSPAGILPKS